MVYFVSKKGKVWVLQDSVEEARAFEEAIGLNFCIEEISLCYVLVLLPSERWNLYSFSLSEM